MDGSGYEEDESCTIKGDKSMCRVLLCPHPNDCNCDCCQIMQKLDEEWEQKQKFATIKSQDGHLGAARD